MRTRNLVTAADRDQRGAILRLAVGIADGARDVWLARPVPQSEMTIARRIRAGESFQIMLDGRLGPRLGIVAADGVDRVIAIEGDAPTAAPFDELPPC